MTAKDTLRYEVEFRSFGGKWEYSEDPDKALKEILGMISNNAKSAKWIKKNVKVIVYSNRVILAEHDPDEVN